MNPTTVVSQHPAPTSAEIAEILRRIDLFEMLSDADLEQVIVSGRVRRLEQGEYLFRAGDPPNSVNVLLAGTIEIIRSTRDNPEPAPVAYLSPGEAIGDMGLFSRTARRSAGRVPEFADVLTLSLPVFEELTRTVPGYGLAIAKVFARRLEGFIMRMRGKRRRTELSGKLKFFDLLTVVQTLLTSKQTGVLTITDDDGETCAEVLLLDGSVERARCGLLEGTEAVYQLFHNDGQGEFFFRTLREPDLDSISKIRIPLPAMNLLMEAMRLMDELPSVRRRLPDPDKPYQAQTLHLQWEDSATVAIAEQIMGKLREPRAIADLIGEVSCSAFTLYRVAAELWESQQIA